jgi:hypothetical protein
MNEDAFQIYLSHFYNFHCELIEVMIERVGSDETRSIFMDSFLEFRKGNENLD